MKKNAQIHLHVESELREKLMKEANENNISMNELCLQRLRKNSQLDRIEMMLDEVLKKKDRKD